MTDVEDDERKTMKPLHTSRGKAIHKHVASWAVLLLSGMLGACVPASAELQQAGLPPAPMDTLDRTLPPTGYGSLRQDDVSLQVNGEGFLLRAIPLDESVIRLLTPDSYRAMRDLRESNRGTISKTAQRYGGRVLSVWFISFYGLKPEARFTPMDVTVLSGGQEFRPYELVPLTTGFSTQRLRLRETQSALYLFDGAIQLEQPISFRYQTARDDSWEQTLQRIERERVMIRARASKP